jgi:hypothetical protein
MASESAVMTRIELGAYAVTDDFFGAPFIDVDKDNESPTPHRYIHGGFKGTDTRFAFCFPPADRYRGRLYQPLEGANAGHENVNTGPLGLVTGGLEMAFRLGGYTVESNMGHIGDVMDAKAGPDPTIYGFRAAAECARFSKYVAAQIYGAPPSYAYVFGGSGGARRSPLCLAYAPGVWDAALPYMGDDEDGEHGDMRRLRGATPHFGSMFNVQRVLGPKIYDVVDAMWPGGSGDPFAGLDTHQREELANLYRLGYPRGDEFMIAQPMGQMWLWTSMAERISQDPYFKAFWTEPGHVGHDEPQHVEHDLIDVRTTVKRPLLARQLVEEPEFQGPEFARLRALASVFAGMNDMWDIPMAVQLTDAPAGYRVGAGVKLLSGKVKGRQLYCMADAGDVWLGSGEGEAANQRFSGVEAGDEVHLSNRDFLAYCYYYRHHLRDVASTEFLRLGGKPIYPQYQQPELSPFMGVVHTGRFEGKMMWVHHTHDASLWPLQGIGMKNNVEREYGREGAAKKFRLRWSENAEHVPPAMAASPPTRANSTWLINYQPIIEQSLADLADWVEKGIEPAGTNFEVQDGGIVLSANAAERGGIQPVVAVSANGGARAEVRVGEAVKLEVRAEVPPGAGAIVGVKWDFDGSGTYPETQAVDGKASAVTLSTTHAFDKPDVYFCTALVESHRDGDVNASSRRIPNLAAARVVVS